MEISAEFHRKIVTFSTMERDLRITFATGAAVIALAIALNLFGEHLGPRILTLAGYIPLGTIIFLVAGEMVVLTLIGLALLRVKGTAALVVPRRDGSATRLSHGYQWALAIPRLAGSHPPTLRSDAPELSARVGHKA